MASEYLARKAIEITPSDTEVQDSFSAIYVGTTGNIKVKDAAGNTATFVGVPAGAILPLSNVELIYDTDTTASDLVGLK